MGRPATAITARRGQEEDYHASRTSPSHKVIIADSAYGGATTVSGKPAVSVIVPARNEESCLGACLESLAGQSGITFEIIVVDDASTDRTRAIAESFPSVRVIDAGLPPSGWTGKNNAVAAGAKVARGDWLLFTDADTVHKPNSLARAIIEANQRCVALLSYSPEQEVHGFWEKAVMPVDFCGPAATYRPSQVSDPGSAAAAANGQYILISRQAYEAVGGHGAVQRQPAGRRRIGPRGKEFRSCDLFSLRRRCGTHPDVSQLRPASRRLDQRISPYCFPRHPVWPCSG